MLHIQRYDTAEKELQKAISLEPAFIPSYGSLGMLRLRQDREDEALKVLAKAVESDSQNHMAHYYYASLLQKFKNDESADERRNRLELMRTHLKRCVELAPRFAEAYNWLGFVAVSLRDELDETEAALGKAIGLFPGREGLRLSLADVMFANNKTAAARTLVAALQARTTNPAIRDRTTTMLEVIANRLQSEQAMREYEARRREAQAEAKATAVGEETSGQKSMTEQTAPDAPPTLSRRTSTTAQNGGTTSSKAPSDRRVNGPEVEGC